MKGQGEEMWSVQEKEECEAGVTAELFILLYIRSITAQ